MQQAAVESSAPDPSFASFLASLAAPPQPVTPQHTNQAWDDDLLADDTASFSYENSLRTHERHSSSDPLPEPGSESPQSQPDRNAPAPPDSALKRASITIRLTEPECAQLRRRAAEAGLTVSAYLRSCAFEVESLRTQVKEALAQLREPAPVPAMPLPTKSSPWSRFWSFGRTSAGRRPA
jgi:hypothetical protein